MHTCICTCIYTCRHVYIHVPTQMYIVSCMLYESQLPSVDDDFDYTLEYTVY